MMAGVEKEKKLKVVFWCWASKKERRKRRRLTLAVVVNICVPGAVVATDANRGSLVAIEASSECSVADGCGRPG